MWWDYFKLYRLKKQKHWAKFYYLSITTGTYYEYYPKPFLYTSIHCYMAILYIWTFIFITYVVGLFKLSRVVLIQSAFEYVMYDLLFVTRHTKFEIYVESLIIHVHPRTSMNDLFSLNKTQPMVLFTSNNCFIVLYYW